MLPKILSRTWLNSLGRGDKRRPARVVQGRVVGPIEYPSAHAGKPAPRELVVGRHNSPCRRTEDPRGGSRSPRSGRRRVVNRGRGGFHRMVASMPRRRVVSRRILRPPSVSRATPKTPDRCSWTRWDRGNRGVRRSSVVRGCWSDRRLRTRRPRKTCPVTKKEPGLGITSPKSPHRRCRPRRRPGC